MRFKPRTSVTRVVWLRGLLPTAVNVAETGPTFSAVKLPPDANSGAIVQIIDREAAK